MRRSTDRIVTTHAGSLVRTPELVSFMRKIDAGEPYDEAAFEATLRRDVEAVVRRQAEARVDVPSDGEYGKAGWTRYITDRLGGLEFRGGGAGQLAPIAGPDRQKFAGFYEYYERLETTAWLPRTPDAPAAPERPRPGVWVCTGPITYTGQAAVARDIANLKAAMPGPRVLEAFLPVAAPCSVETRIVNEYYKSDEEMLFALAEALREEYKPIVDAGLILQVDDAHMPALYARLLPDVSMADYRKYVELRIEALNHALEGIRASQVRYHICWGSQNVPHTNDVPLKEIVDLVLKVRAQAYSIEAANPRHEHEWQVWEEVKLPEDKILIPGLVSHATNIVEHPDLIAWRILNFTRLVGREQVIAGTDCGFSQNWNLVRVHPEVQWAKLEALAEGARVAGRKLWPRP
jgi:5-methyltetrahydropteroyltriglutamate--homocysteine methyltransferase